MEVIFDDQVFHTQKRGGISRYICTLAGHLASLPETNVTLFCGYTENDFASNCVPGACLRKIHLARKQKYRVNSFIKKVCRRWLQLRVRMDFTGRTTVYHPSFYDYDKVVKSRTSAMVLTVHDMIDEIYGGSQKSIERKRNAVLAADAIICVSQSTKNDLLRLIPEAGPKAHVVYLASDVGKQSAVRQSESSVFLHVGNRSAYKNGINVIKAFIQVARIHPTPGLVLCGPALSAEEHELLRSEGFLDRVRHETPSDSELANIYAEAIALVYPSSYEGFGLPVLEAMQLGCPVITSPVSSLPEVGGEAALYVDAQDINGLAAAMQLVWEDGQQRQRMREAGFLQAAKFSWERHSTLTREIYLSALASSEFDPSKTARGFLANS
jgi:glycosyltransferase involved in cell wall biosynthesis